MIFLHLISRAKAREIGASTYFTGKACKRGGIGPRSVSEGRCQCADCLVERRQYFHENKERLPASNAEWRTKNRDQWLSTAKRYREENQEAVKAGKARHYAENADAINDRKKRAYAADPSKAKQGAQRYREQNPEKVAETGRVYRAKNANEIALKGRKWRSENKDKVRRYVEQNREKFAAKYAVRRARKLNAFPSWAGELDRFVWQEAADLVRLRREATGISWAADHMVPLASKRACGLHVWNNCQVIPSDLNGRKANKLILTEPDEWLKYI